MIAFRLGLGQLTVVVGTPGYFKRYLPPETPHNLNRHARIGLPPDDLKATFVRGSSRWTAKK